MVMVMAKKLRSTSWVLGMGPTFYTRLVAEKEGQSLALALKIQERPFVECVTL